jgi:hypothetical protein
MRELAGLGMDVAALDLRLRRAVTDASNQSHRTTQLDQLVDVMDVVLTTAGGLLAEVATLTAPTAPASGLRLGPMPTTSPDQPMQSNIGEKRADG